jgi:hypothetical protein
VTRVAASVACLLLGLALACGKYGPPVRAGAEPAAKKPAVAIPLPVVPEGETRRPAPAEPAPAPETEEEPPPEGAP